MESLNDNYSLSKVQLMGFGTLEKLANYYVVRSNTDPNFRVFKIVLHSGAFPGAVFYDTANDKAFEAFPGASIAMEKLTEEEEANAENLIQEILEGVKGASSATD